MRSGGAVGIALWCAAWWWGRDVMRARRHLTAIMTSWTLPLLVAPPLFSHDAWAYAAQGQILVRGSNPYVLRQGAPPLGSLVDHHWADSTAVYPPGSLWIQAAMVRLAGEHPYWSTVTMRIPALVAVALMAWTVVRLAKLARIPAGLALWLGPCNPLVLAHAIGGMHNDALQCALALLALVAAGTMARAGCPWLGLVAGGTLVGLAGLVKQPGVLAGLGVVAIVHQQSQQRGKTTSWPTILAQLVVAAAPALVVFRQISSIRGLGFGWLSDTAGSPLQATSDSPISLIVQGLVWQGADLDELVPAATINSLVLTVVAFVWCWAKWGPSPGRTRDPLTFQAAICFAFVLCGVAIQPWYFMFPLLATSLTPFARRRTALLALLSVLLVVLSGLQTFMSPYLALPIVAILGWLAWRRAKVGTPSSDGK